MPKLHILMAPSETKSQGGAMPCINQESFLFKELYGKREVPLKAYQGVIDRYDLDTLIKMFGIKNEKQIQEYCLDIFASPTKKAIERYTGVAFDYLAYNSLDTQSKTYIDERVILFSNIFGPIAAKDHLPLYKFKQGEKLAGFSIESYYKEHFSASLDRYLSGEIIDLRAGVYEKFYKISKPYTTFKFLKEGKVVSHWAKAYRGRLLNVLAQNNVSRIDDIEKVLPADMNIIAIEQKELAQNFTIEVSPAQ